MDRYKNSGRAWQPQGESERVNVDDVMGEEGKP